MTHDDHCRHKGYLKMVPVMAGRHCNISSGKQSVFILDMVMGPMVTMNRAMNIIKILSGKEMIDSTKHHGQPTQNL